MPALYNEILNALKSQCGAELCLQPLNDLKTNSNLTSKDAKILTNSLNRALLKC